LLARIFKHGTGSGIRAIGYLLNGKDHSGQDRENLPELLRGDPEFSGTLINSLSFAQKYTSGVLSFTEEEARWLEENLEVRFQLIESFERDFLAPGLDQDRLSTVWVQHRDHDRTELHFVIANVDLETGKRFPAYFDRADRSRLAAWQDYQNLSRGLNDPRDLSRRRAFQHDDKLPKEKAELAQALEKIVAQKCVNGELQDRKAIISFIESKGLAVGRQGKEYITVIHGEGKLDRFRLKGELFHENYRSDRAITAGVGREQTADRADPARSLEQVRKRLETAVQFRRDYLTKRFRRVEGLDIGRGVQLQERSDSADRGFGKAYSQTHVDPQSMDRDSHHFDVGGVRPGHFDDVDMDAKRAVESPHVAGTDDRQEDLPSNRRSYLEELQHQQQFKISGMAAMQDDARRSREIGEHDQHPERAGHPTNGFLAAIEQRISAARRAFDRTIRGLRDALHGSIERAQEGAKRTLEALGRTDKTIQRHAGTHAANRSIVERFERQTQQVSRNRGRDISR
jgi:relaxase-like protein